MKTTIILGGIDSILDTEEEKISKLEDREIEILWNEQRKKDKINRINELHENFG